MLSSQAYEMSAAELSRAIRNRQLSALEAMQSVLARCHRVNPVVNALTLILEEEALAQARAADQALARGDVLGPLHGVPFSTKINTDQIGCPTDNGVRLWRDRIAKVDAPSIAHLRRAGAIAFARSNSPALAMRADTVNLPHGRTVNPHDAGRIAGGSSGGAAVAVAVGMGPIALGNDRGGSIRWPAYCTGVAGLRPSRGRIAHAMSFAPLARSLTTQEMSVQGPLARHAGDLRLAFEAMIAPDSRDGLHVPLPARLPPPAWPVRVALVLGSPGAKVAAYIVEALQQSARALESAGYVVEEVAAPSLDRMCDVFHGIRNAEFALSRRDLMQETGDADLIKAYELLWSIAPPLQDTASVLDLWAERDRIINEWSLFMDRFALVLLPLGTEVAPAFGADVSSTAHTRQLMHSMHFLYLVSALGMPAMSLPAGRHGHLPIGVQLVARRFREDMLLDAAEAIEHFRPAPRVVDPTGQQRR